MNGNYSTLVNILDKIIDSKPEGKFLKLYSTESDVELNQSRSRAYIHLYMMAKFGLLDFVERESLITDGSYDGGVDAYYIDSDKKVIYLIQSKFRLSSENFEKKNIDISELLNMDIKLIISGEVRDGNNNEYNGKIKGFQRKLGDIRGIGKYDYKVVILANANYKLDDLRKLTGGFETQVYDFKKTYSELVFPVVSGNYFSQNELEVNINLAKAEHPRIKYNVDLGGQQATITVLFAPTLEIAKILHKYKNSILKFNPRSYLDMRKNSVNEEILHTLNSSRNNEFALFNNGITFISGDCHFSENTGKKNSASLTLSTPQIINGGQTAYTLSRAYQKSKDNPEELDRIFSGKEVLVKIISFIQADDTGGDSEEYSVPYAPEQLRIIESVSQATNRQNPIDDADRKANDKSQVDFQLYAFSNFGLYYERKRGEFGDGLISKYIGRDQLIIRDDLVRCCLASDGKAGEARRSNKKYLFSNEVIGEYLKNDKNHNKYLIAYSIFTLLKNIEKDYRTQNDKYAVSKFGSALRYGKFAVVSAVMKVFPEIEDVSEIRASVETVLSKWKDFESIIVQKPSNSSFFKNDLNMLNYYKSNNINVDLKADFSI